MGKLRPRERWIFPGASPTSVWFICLPTATKAKLVRHTLVEKKKLRDTWEAGGSRHKAHLNFSVQAEDFIRRERESQTDWEGGLKRSLHAGHSHKDLETGQGMVRCASNWSLSSGFSITLFYVWRWANLPELGWLRWLKVRVCIFLSYFLWFLYKLAVSLQATYQSESACHKNGEVGYNLPLLQHSLVNFSSICLEVRGF